MAHFTSLDARVERIEFGKSQDGDPFFKVIKLVRGRHMNIAFSCATTSSRAIRSSPL